MCNEDELERKRLFDQFTELSVRVRSLTTE